MSDKTTPLPEKRNGKNPRHRSNAQNPQNLFYAPFAGGKAEEWRIPPNSTFDHMVLKYGQRYRVDTKDLFVPDYS